MSSFSIGFYREDGDFELLATVNNNAQLLPDNIVETICDTILEWCTAAGVTDAVVLERQDAPDVVSLENE